MYVLLLMFISYLNTIELSTTRNKTIQFFSNSYISQKVYNWFQTLVFYKARIWGYFYILKNYIYTCKWNYIINSIVQLTITESLRSKHPNSLCFFIRLIRDLSSPQMGSVSGIIELSLEGMGGRQGSLWWSVRWWWGM